RRRQRTFGKEVAEQVRNPERGDKRVKLPARAEQCRENLLAYQPQHAAAEDGEAHSTRGADNAGPIRQAHGRRLAHAWPWVCSVCRQRSRTASVTCSTVMLFMQRKSIGHSRRKHGVHSTLALTIRMCGPRGPVSSAEVEPKM